MELFPAVLPSQPKTEAVLKKAEMKTSLVLSKNLLYSTGNYTQYFVITYKETEFEKEYVYIYIFPGGSDG